MTGHRLPKVRERFRRLVATHRRWLAAGLAGVAVIVGINAARPAAPATKPVAVAAHDLPAGRPLQRDDLATIQLDTSLVPEGVLDARHPPLGRLLVAPVRAGQPLTDLALVQPALLDGYPAGTVLATIRVTDPAVGDVVHPGDWVDVVGADLRGGGASVIARAAPVIALPGASQPRATGEGQPLVIAVPEATALALAESGVRDALTVVVTSPPEG